MAAGEPLPQPIELGSFLPARNVRSIDELRADKLASYENTRSTLQNQQFTDGEKWPTRASAAVQGDRPIREIGCVPRFSSAWVSGLPLIDVSFFGGAIGDQPSASAIHFQEVTHRQRVLAEGYCGMPKATESKLASFLPARICAGHQPFRPSAKLGFFQSPKPSRAYRLRPAIQLASFSTRHFGCATSGVFRLTSSRACVIIHLAE